MTKQLFNIVGGYNEAWGEKSGTHFPEDLDFFHRHLTLWKQGVYSNKTSKLLLLNDNDSSSSTSDDSSLSATTITTTTATIPTAVENIEPIIRIPKPLCVYRYHANCTSWRIPYKELLKVRVKAFEERVLSMKEWESFTIWGCGRDGCNFLKMLSPENRHKVRAMCDIDRRKIGQPYVHKEWKDFRLPRIHFSEAKAPIVLCVAMDRTDGEFEANVKSLGLVEGKDYYHFF